MVGRNKTRRWAALLVADPPYGTSPRQKRDAGNALTLSPIAEYSIWLDVMDARVDWGWQRDLWWQGQLYRQVRRSDLQRRGWGLWESRTSPGLVRFEHRFPGTYPHTYINYKKQNCFYSFLPLQWTNEAHLTWSLEWQHGEPCRSSGYGEIMGSSFALWIWYSFPSIPNGLIRQKRL